MSEIQKNVDDIQKKADELGVAVVWPQDNELFIDIDNSEDFKIFFKHFDRLNEHFVKEGLSPATYRDHFSKSGYPKRHVVVILPVKVKNELERLAMQAFLGSDRMRELVAWVRLQHNPDHHPTVFFEGQPIKARENQNIYGGF
jgi:hypothetical protein